MRLHIKLISKGITIPYDHQPKLVGTIHKWLGKENEEHGSLSLYSFSRLGNAKSIKNGLRFESDSSFFFSSFESSLIKRLTIGIIKDPLMFDGLIVKEIIIQEDPNFDGIDFFQVASPILLKRKNGEHLDHLKFDNPLANNVLKEILIKKLDSVGIKENNFQIEFISNYMKASTKLLNYNNIQNRANWCPVKITGSHTVKAFAWNVGLGHSTGIGFGALK